MKAIIVCVDFADLLSITLPYNRHHFDQIMIVTARNDIDTQYLAQKNQCQLLLTDAFYEDGAVFNKWKALEEGLDVLGREGWLCIMDADVLWPKRIEWNPGDHYQYGSISNPGEAMMSWEYSLLSAGNLYTPKRRMWEEWPAERTMPIWWTASGRVVPPESYWSRFPLHRQQQEFAGYSQIFRADDPHLGPAPWHEIDWKHAGGADSFFQMKWPDACKIRPPFEVLHLGPAGVNWCGRASARVDGTLPPEAFKRKQMLKDFMAGRVAGPDRFKGEKLA